MDEDYSKRELDEHMKDIKDSVEAVAGIVEKIDDKVEKIDVKVGIQNGRVSKLEGKFNGVALAGTCAVVLIGVIMSLVVYSFMISQENLKNSILLEVSGMNR